MNEIEEFTLDAEAILQEAPDYDTGVNTLLSTYSGSQFTDPLQAGQVLSEYGSKLGEKFQTQYFSYGESLEVLPVPLDEVEGEGMERINTWQKLNEQELEKAEDPDTLIYKQRLLNSAKRAAISERRKLNGKDTLDELEERQAKVTEDESTLGMLGRKFAGGFLPTVRPLFGEEESAEYYEAEDPEAGLGEKIAGDVATGGGFLTRTLGMAGAGAAAGSFGGPAGAAIGAAAGTVGSVAIEGISAVKRAFTSSEEATGSTSRAVGAAAIEGTSQTLQAALGGKAIYGAGKRVIGKTLGSLSREALTLGGQGALTGGLGAAVSTLGQEVGQGEGLSGGQILENTLRGTVAGGTLGAGTGALVGGLFKAPPDSFKSETNTIDNVQNPKAIADPDSRSAIAEKGDTEVEHSPARNTAEVPYDHTYQVSSELAAKIEVLKNSVDPEGESVKIYADDSGRLVFENPYLDANLELQDTPQGLGKIIPKETSGDTLVGVNRPRADTNGSTIYNSKVLGKSAGAAHVTEMGTERGFARKIRTNPAISERMKFLFGDPEGPGISRYTKAPLTDRVTEAGTRIDEIGLEAAVGELLSLDSSGNHDAQTQAFGGEVANRVWAALRQAQDEGDVEATAHLHELWDDVSRQYDAIGTQGGQALQARKAFQQNPVQETVGIARALSRQDAIREESLESKVPVEELRKTDAELKVTEEALTELASREDPEVIQLDKDLSETQDLIKIIDEEGAEKQKKFQDQEKRRADREDALADRIEDENKPKEGKEPSPRKQKRAERLRKSAQERRDRAQEAIPEDFIPAPRRKQKRNLEGAQETLRKKRQDIASVFDEANQEKYTELTEKAKSLRERKRRVDKKTNEKFKERLPQEKIKRLEELSQAQRLLPEDSPAREKIQTEIDLLKHDMARSYKSKFRTLTDALQTYYVANMLFRASTQAVNLGFSALKVPFKAVAYSLTGVGGGASPWDGLAYLGRFISAAKETGFREGVEVFKTGRASLKPRLDTEDGNLVLKDSAESGFELRKDKQGNLSVKPPSGREDPVKTIRNIPYFGKFLQPLGYSLRALSAGDAVFTRSAIEAEAHVLALQEGRRKGLKGKEMKQFLGEKLFNSETDSANALKQAKNEAEILKKAGVVLSENEVLSNAWAIMERQRATDLRIASAYAAGIDFLNQDVMPRGFIGEISKDITALFNREWPLPNGKFINNPLNIIQPFVSTMLKVANVSLNTTPIGFGKALAGKFIHNEPSNVVRDQLGSAIFGTTVMGLAYGVLQANKDDPNPYFNITGAVPRDAKARQQFYDSGKKPFSIEIAGQSISYVPTPLFAPLAAVATLADRMKTDKDFNSQDGLSVISTLMAGSFRAFADLNALKLSSALLEAISTGIDAQDAIKNSAAGITKNLFFPYNTVAQEIARAYDNPRTTRNNFWAKALSNTPFASVAGARPALNLFGEPVERNWLEKIPFVGSVAGRFYGQQTNDPDILWMVNNGYSPLGIEYKVRLGSQDPKWQGIKESREEKLGAVFNDLLTDEEQYKLQKRVGPEYRAIVSRYRTIYGDGKFDEAVQKELTKEMSEAKSRAKLDLFLGIGAP